MPIFTHATSSPCPLYPNHFYASGKRPRCVVNLDPDPHASTHFAKRCRKMITPRSAALSVVTPENDTNNATLASLPLPPTQIHPQQPTRYVALPYSSLTPAFDCNLLSYGPNHYYSNPTNLPYTAPQVAYAPAYHPDYSPGQLDYPAPSSAFPPSPSPPVGYQQPACNFSLQSLNCGALSPQASQFGGSPGSSQFPNSPQSPGHSFQTDSPGVRLLTDIGNSFATGDTGTISWTNNLLIRVLAFQLDQTCVFNQRGAPIFTPTSKCHIFFSQNKQPFNLDFYMARLVQYANCSTAAFVSMLIYIDRLQSNCPELLLSEMNCHRIIMGALVLAIKYLDDEVFSNSHYARVGGVTPQEMNQLEITLLELLNWNLHVSPEDYAVYEERLINSAAAATTAHPASQASTTLSPQVSPTYLSSPV